MPLIGSIGIRIVVPVIEPRIAHNWSRSSGLTEGVILVEPNQNITCANEAALEMHGVTHLNELGRAVDEYRKNFVLHHQGTHLLDQGAGRSGP